jgi:ElaB/YqjD/DUF883 family membrane-anchored ribosome-binding protein
MQSAQNPSIEELRIRSELARTNLTTTVRDLRDRFSDTTTDVQALLNPTRVKQEVQSYARRTGEDMYQRVEDKIRQNPLQAAAIGAGLAYPVLSILRRMPVPLMLLGAGFWLAGQKKANMKPQLAHAGDEESALQRATNLVADAPSIVSDLGQQVGQHLERTAATASEKLTETVNAASERFSQVAASVSQTAEKTRTWGNQAISRSQQSASDFIDQNPMLVAGLGIGAGALLAALLPATRAERKALGPAAASLQEGAAAAAAKGMNSMRAASDTKTARLAEDLDREGLGPRGLTESAGRLVESAKAVAERGLQAALEEESSAPEQPKQRGIGEMP